MKLAEQLYYNIIIGAEQRNIHVRNIEKHHVIPKCVTKTDNTFSVELKKFTVPLTYQEHFYCHWLLRKIYPKNRGVHFAWWRMCNNKNQIYGNISAKLYEEARQTQSILIKQRKFSVATIEQMKLSARGKKLSENTKNNMRIAHKNIYPVWLVGVKKSKEACQKMSLSHKGMRNRPIGFKHSTKTKEKMSQAKIGRKFSPQHLINLRKALAKRTGTKNPNISQAKKGKKYNKYHL